MSFTFKFGNETWTANEGDTWENNSISGVLSEGYSFIGDYVYGSGYGRQGWVRYNGSIVKKTDLIKAGTYSHDGGPYSEIVINQTSYTVYNAPTWESWINSSYNTNNNIIIYEDYVADSSNSYQYVAYEDGTLVKSSDSIILQYSYQLSSGDSGGTSSTYVGIGGVARALRGAYVGVNGVARKLLKAYVGDANGIARLCYSSSVVKLITFTIAAGDVSGDGSYLEGTQMAQEEMTWSEWLVSDLSNYGESNAVIVSGDGYVYDQGYGTAYYTSDGNQVKGTDVIVAGASYIASQAVPGDVVFNIDGVSYSTDKGTWGAWIESLGDSTSLTTTSDGYILDQQYGDYYYITLNDYTFVRKDDAIVAGTNYNTKHFELTAASSIAGEDGTDGDTGDITFSWNDAIPSGGYYNLMLMNHLNPSGKALINQVSNPVAIDFSNTNLAVMTDDSYGTDMANVFWVETYTDPGSVPDTNTVTVYKLAEAKACTYNAELSYIVTIPGVNSGSTLTWYTNNGGYGTIANVQSDGSDGVEITVPIGASTLSVMFTRDGYFASNEKTFSIS